VAVTSVGSASNTGTGITTTGAITSPAYTLPTGTAAGDRVFISSVSVGQASAPSGWTQVLNVNLGSGTMGASTGPRWVMVCYRDYDGVWTMPTVTVASAAANTMVGMSQTMRKATTETWDTPLASSGSHTTLDTAFSVTSPTSLALKTSGALWLTLSFEATPGALTGQNFSSPGSSFGTLLAATAVVNNTTGNDASAVGRFAPITTGATGAPTYTITLTTARTGGVGFVHQGASTAAVTIQGLGDGTASSVGTGTGTPVRAGLGDGVASSVGTGTGSRVAIGAGDGVASSVGTGSGLRIVSGLGNASATSVGAPATTGGAYPGTDVFPSTDSYPGVGGGTVSDGVPIRTGLGNASATSVGTGAGLPISVTVQGLGDGTASSIGAGAGGVVRTGQGAGAASSVGASPGQRVVPGSGAGAASSVGTATGGTVRPGTGSGAVSSVGTGAGAPIRTGSGAGTASSTGTGTGIPILPTTAGIGAGTASSTGTGSGYPVRGGSGAATASSTGSAGGARVVRGSGAATASSTSSATGYRPVYGEGDADATSTATGAAGKRISSGIGAATATSNATGAGRAIPGPKNRYKIGGTAPTKMYVGTQPVDAVYQGNTLVWP
jgi:hypothetical protein